jgi:protein-S-isoprenylcysteine O-methyltransferase Ste14
MIRRSLLVLYAVACYLFAVFTMLYGAGFMLNVGVPRSIDIGPDAPLAQALLIDLGLIALFGLQHSLMARPAIKRFLRRFVPAPAERSTYLLATSIAFSLFWFWRPLPAPVWQVELPAARLLLLGLFWFGMALVLVSTYLIDHFALLGLRQAFDGARGRTTPEGEFRTPSLYRYSRHPMMVGMLITFWATPTMTAGHLLFALGMSAYVLIGIAFEERDLLRHFGARYAAYRAQVPMLLPLPRRQQRHPTSERTL